MEERVTKIEDSLDKHLEIYAKNGIELERLGNLIDKLITKYDKFESIENKRWEDSKAMRDTFTAGTITARVAKWLIGLSASAVGLVLGIKALIK